MAVLPRFAVLQSVRTKSYLNFTNDRDERLPVGFMKFDGEDVVSPLAKFELEITKSTEGQEKGWVHIRSCYNNRYWVRDEGSGWVVAGAEKQEEDQSKTSCTLFQVEKNESNFTFRHVGTRRFACLWTCDAPFYGGMQLASELPDHQSYHLYTLVNWGNLVVFPKRVAFKGDNGKYLCIRLIEGYQYLQFAETARDKTAEYEVTTIGNGCIRLKSIANGQYWRRSPNWIWTDTSDESSNNPDTLFWAVKITNDKVALRNMGNNNFCHRLTTEGKTDCLNASSYDISSTSELVLEELVVSRDIYHINFHIGNARVYNESLIALATGGATNESYGTESKSYTLKMVYKDIKTTTWNNSISLKLGLKTTIQIAAIPLIVDGKIELSTEFAWTSQWGETHTTETDVETSYTVAVPPRTRTIVSLVATQALCDVPFSYTQSDILTNGDPVLKIMTDGVFTGGNYFHFEFKEKQEKL